MQIQLNFKTKDDAIKSKMGNVYFLLIEKLIEKGNKNVIEENINKIAYKINTEKDEEMKSQYEFISQILQKKKIKYELTNKDKTKEKGKIIILL